MGEVTIREFEAGDEAAFRQLNEEWILRYFRMELKDEEILGDPRGAILEGGGRILFAVRNGERVGCCALIPMEGGAYELGKMAVSEKHRGSGIGRSLLDRAIGVVRASGAAKLYLETHRSLGPAVRLYESMGFRHLGPASTPSPYARSDIRMELLLDGPE